MPRHNSPNGGKYAKGGLSMEIYVGKHMPLTEAESLYDKMWDDFFGDRKNRVRNRRERAKQDISADNCGDQAGCGIDCA